MIFKRVIFLNMGLYAEISILLHLLTILIITVSSVDLQPTTAADVTSPRPSVTSQTFGDVTNDPEFEHTKVSNGSLHVTDESNFYYEATSKSSLREESVTPNVKEANLLVTQQNQDDRLAELPEDDVTTESFETMVTDEASVTHSRSRKPDVIKYGIFKTTQTVTSLFSTIMTSEPSVTTSATPTTVSTSTPTPRSRIPKPSYEPCPISCRCSAPPGVKRRHPWHNLMVQYRMRHLVYGHRPDGYGYRSDMRRMRVRSGDVRAGRQMTCVGLHDFPDYVPQGESFYFYFF